MTTTTVAALTRAHRAAIAKHGHLRCYAAVSYCDDEGEGDGTVAAYMNVTRPVANAMINAGRALRAEHATRFAKAPGTCLHHEGMVMVYDKSGLFVCEGDTVTLRDNERATVIDGTAPRHRGSTGRVYVRTDGFSDGREYCPGVINAGWVKL